MLKETDELEWFVKKGSSVSEGDLLARARTDTGIGRRKRLLEITSPYSGTVAELSLAVPVIGRRRAAKALFGAAKRPAATYLGFAKNAAIVASHRHTARRVIAKIRLSEVYYDRDRLFSGITIEDAMPKNSDIYDDVIDAVKEVINTDVTPKLSSLAKSVFTIQTDVSGLKTDVSGLKDDVKKILEILQKPNP